MDREAASRLRNPLSPAQYQARIREGQTENPVPPLRRRTDEPPAARIGRRWTSSADGKIDLFEIVSSDGQPLPAWQAGAHIDITITPEFIRQFSLAGDPADRGRYLLGILREDQGRGGSLKIHQMLRQTRRW